MDNETGKRETARIPQWCRDAASAVLAADPCMCKGAQAAKVSHLGLTYATIIAQHSEGAEPGLAATALQIKLENREELLHATLSYIRREVQGY